MTKQAVAVARPVAEQLAEHSAEADRRYVAALAADRVLIDERIRALVAFRVNQAIDAMLQQS